MTVKPNIGVFEHCQQQFRYEIFHCGLGDSVYAYCDVLRQDSNSIHVG